MVIARDPGQSVDYVLEEDRSLDPKDQTRFKIKFLTNRQRAEIEDNIGKMNKDGSYELRAGSYPMDIVKLGLMGWEGFKNENGEDVPFTKTSGTDKASEKSLDYLRPAWITELANAITEKNTITEDEQKN